MIGEPNTTIIFNSCIELFVEFVMCITILSQIGIISLLIIDLL